LVSLLVLVLTLQLDKSFLAFSNGILSSSSADANSYRSSGEKIMNYDWVLLQTLIFIITPFFVMLALSSRDEDDDDGGSGMMIPSAVPSA